MDLSKLTYTKSPSERHPKDSFLRTPETKVGRVKTVGIPTVASAYQKLEGVLSTNLIFVLSGGEKKEKDFLRELIKQHEPHSLRVVFMSEKRQGLQPYQMQEKWREIEERGEFSIDSQRYRMDTMDKVFLLSDVDEYYEQLVEIHNGTVTGDQGQWIISNPCFEIWLYYCYRDNPEVDLADLIHLTVTQRSKKLKSLGQTVVSGGLNPCLAFERLYTGIEHTKSHYDIDENSIPVLFATQMHDMAQYIVDTMNKNANEYAEYVKQKGEWRKSMKNATTLNSGSVTP